MDGLLRAQPGIELNWILWRWWVAVSVIAGIISAVVTWILNQLAIGLLFVEVAASLGDLPPASRPGGMLILVSLLGVSAAAAPAGVLEWLVLRRYVAGAWRWIIVKVVGAMVIGFLKLIPVLVARQNQTLPENLPQQMMLMSLLAVLCSAIVATFQWLILGHLGTAAVWWIPVALVAPYISAMMSSPVVFFLLTSQSRRSGTFFPLIGPGLGESILIALLTAGAYGALTGLLLAWLLRKPSPYPALASAEAP